jgi:hypothetical protein
LDHLLEALQYLHNRLSGALATINEWSKAYHIPDLRIRVVRHGVLEGSQEIFLKLEMGQFLLFEEPHSKLSQGIEGKKSDMGVTVAADL